MGYCPTALTSAVADLTIMLALMATRLGGDAMRRVADGEWPKLPWAPLQFCGPQITNSTIGFLGFGRIAQATLQRFLPFNPSKALYLGSQPGQKAKQDYFGLLKEQKIPIEPAADWQQLAKESDILIVGCALNEQSKHAVNAEFFKLMKKRAVVVNIARGYVMPHVFRIFGRGLT